MQKCPCFQTCGCTELDYVDKERHTPKRGCTDIYCLIVFFAFIVGMCLCAAVSAGIGDPNRLIYGVDSWGNACNQKNNKKIDNVSFSGRDTSGLQKVFYFNFLDAARDKPTKPIVCVSTCPNSTANLTDYGMIYTEEKIEICRYDITKEHFYDNITFDENLCPAAVTPHVSILNRCVPTLALKIGQSIQSGVVNVLDATFEVIQYSKCDAKSSWIRKLSADVLTSWRELLILSFVSLAIVIIICVLSCFFAKIMIWAMYIGAAATSLAGTEYCWHRWYKLRSLLNLLDLDQQLPEDKELVSSWLVYAIMASIFTIVWLILLLYMTRKFNLVVEFMQESGYAFRDMPGLLVQPVLTLGILVIAIVILGAVQLNISSAGHPVVDKSTGFVTYVLDKGSEVIMRYYCMLGALWVIQFIVACQQFIVAGATSRWYFTIDKAAIKQHRCIHILAAHHDLVRYHLGTVSIGSFTIILCQFPRVFYTFLLARLKGKDSAVVRHTRKCCCGGIWAFEKFLKYINRNAYIISSIYGQNFWLAGGRVWTMLFANVLRMAHVNFVGTFTLFLGQVTIMAFVTIIGMELIQPSYGLCFWYAPLLMNAFISLMITYVFLNVFGMAIDTMFLCFNEDCEQNDGTDASPYFMHSRLAKNIDHKQDFELEMRRKRAAYGKPRQSYKPGRYSRVSAGDITATLTAHKQQHPGGKKVAQAPEAMW